MIFESHAHYNDEAFDEDRENLLMSMQENNIEYIINVGASIKSSEETIALIDKYPFMYGAIGVHPDEVLELNEEKMAWLKETAGHEKVVSIGEIGLDYYWDTAPRQLQQDWFVRQLDLAAEVDLPVIIHSRDAAEDTFRMIREHKSPAIGGVVHCYSYSVELAREYVKMGLYIGVGGVVTFKNGRRLQETVKEIPLERILLETDCPYLAPEPNRGKRNSSLNLPYIAEKVADLKGIPVADVIKVTNQNAQRLFFHKEV